MYPVVVCLQLAERALSQVSGRVAVALRSDGAVSLGCCQRLHQLLSRPLPVPAVQASGEGAGRQGVRQLQRADAYGGLRVTWAWSEGAARLCEKKKNYRKQMLQMLVLHLIQLYILESLSLIKHIKSELQD